MSDANFTVFKNNSFDVVITDDTSNSNELNTLGMSVETINVSLFYGEVSLSLYANLSVMNIITELKPHQKLHLKYTLRNKDSSVKFTAFDGDVYVNNISYWSDLHNDKSMKVTVHFKAKDFI